MATALDQSNSAWVMCWPMIWRGWFFGVLDILAWSMFWCCQWFGIVNVMALSMLWPGQYFRTVDVLVQLHECRRATIPEGPQISTSPVHWLHQNTDHAETSTTPKHQQCWPEGPARYCENDQVLASPFSFHALSLSLKERIWRIRGNRSPAAAYM